MSPKRLKQILVSTPHYLSEFRSEVRRRGDIKTWLYFKLPYHFELTDFPVRLTLEPTNLCNFGCLYCRRSMMERPVGKMSQALMESIVRQLAENNSTIVKIGGLGEPALHPDLDTSLNLLRDSGVRVILYTNGTLFKLFTPERIARWKLMRLVISIDGLDARSYEKQRVGGNYAETTDLLDNYYRAVKNERSGRAVVEVRHVIMPHETQADLRAFRAEWLKRADTVMFNRLVQHRPQKRDPRTPQCRDILREMYIRWDGRVPVCGYQDDWIGDVNVQTIKDIWRCNRINELRRAHAERQLHHAPRCQTCGFH